MLVIGGGIAGLSAAAALAEHGTVTVLEAEAQIGFHSSGRSATMLHYALGDRLVRALTLASRSFFEVPPEGFSDVPLATRAPVLIHAREEERAALESLYDDIAPFAALERAGEAEMHALCAVLRVGPRSAVAGIIDRNGLRLDSHALLHGFARKVKALGGRIVAGARVTAIAEGWTVETDSGGSFRAPLLVNAAGAWADVVARMAGVTPLGLRPLERTIITFDAPAGLDVARLPFAKTVHDELYFAPESGRLFASPMDEVPTDPCDAQADEYEVALAAWRVEERTTIKVERIHSRWSGLRTFAPDRHPVVGHASDVEGFFWLAGQGGFGLQTSPAMAAIATALITGGEWPVPGLTAGDLSPARFLG